MALEVPEGFAQVSLSWMLSGDPEPMIVTFGMAEFGGGEPTTMANAVADAWELTFGAPGTLELYTFTGCRVALQNAPSGPPVIGEAPRSIPGEVSGTTLPQNCAFLVKKGTDLGGRSGRGRMYFPPFMAPEADITPTGFIGAPAAGIQTALTAFLAGVDNMYLFHDEALAISPTQVGTLTLDPRIATQRRRLR